MEPQQSAPADDEPIPESIVAAEGIALDAPVPVRPPRVWTALGIPWVALVFVVLFSGIGLSILAASRSSSPDDFQRELSQVPLTIPGFLIAGLATQAALIGAALTAAWLSPVPMKQRLRLAVPSLPLHLWISASVATLFFALVGSFLNDQLFNGESQTMEQIGEAIRSVPALQAFLTVLGISLVPGLTEEIFFRGYIQSRLLQRWHPVGAIFVSGLFFAAFHLEPAHVVAVFPMGIWLGVVAWVTGSVWPAVLCHTFNNAASCVLAWWLPVGEEPALLSLALIAVSAIALLMSTWNMLMGFGPTPIARQGDAFDQAIHVRTDDQSTP